MHPLTELIIDLRRRNEPIEGFSKDVDRVVREWLKEKAEELLRTPLTPIGIVKTLFLPPAKDECFTEEESKWIEPLKEILRKHGVKCDRGSLALMCDIHTLYKKPEPEKKKELWEILRYNRSKYGSGSGEEYWKLQARAAEEFHRGGK